MIHNNTYDFNTIKTGDTVFISGLYGQKYLFINNKIGKVLSIYSSFYENKRRDVAQVVLLDSSTPEVHEINFDYLFKLNNQPSIDSVIGGMVQHENPYLYFQIRDELRNFTLTYDELFQLMGLSYDRTGKLNVFLLSGIN